MSNGVASQLDFNQFPVEIREHDGLYHLICRTFSVIESDPSLDVAYSKLAIKRKKVVSDLQELGIDVTNKFDSDMQKQHATTLQKWMQISIIFMCLGLPLGMFMAVYVVSTKAATFSATVTNSVKHKLITTVNDPSQLTLMLNKVVEKLDNVTPERREEIQIAVRKIVKFAKPIVLELDELHNVGKG